MGASGKHFDVARHMRRVHNRQPSTCRNKQKQQKSDDSHAHQRRGHCSPLVQPAPPTHPASCPCSAPTRSAALRAADSPKLGPSRPIGATRAHMLQPTSAHHSAAAARSRHSLQHLLVVDDHRALAGRRAAACRGATAGRMLRLLLLLNEGDSGGEQCIGRQ